MWKETKEMKKYNTINYEYQTSLHKIRFLETIVHKDIHKKLKTTYTINLKVH